MKALWWVLFVAANVAAVKGKGGGELAGFAGMAALLALWWLWPRRS